MAILDHFIVNLTECAIWDALKKKKKNLPKSSQYVGYP